jgi:hypothetical protein
MNKSLGVIRKENLNYLVDYQYGNQTMLASRLNYDGISQTTISDILRSKRTFHDFEVRALEIHLVLPHLWMDKNSWLSSGWYLVEAYRLLDREQQGIFNNLATFVESQNNAGQG